MLHRLFNLFKDKISVIKLTFRFSKLLEYFGVKWVLLHIWNSIVVYNQSGCDHKKSTIYVLLCMAA